MLKKIAANLAVIAISGMSLSSYATPLSITNYMPFDSTTKVHNILNKCSNDLLGQGGITRAMKDGVPGRNTVSEANLRAACVFSPNECVADVYATPNCSGEIIATMTFSVTKGVQNIAMRAPHFEITANGFDVTLKYNA